MLEQICRNSLRNMCAEIIYQHNPPLFKLKGDTSEQPENPYKNFFSDRFDWFINIFHGVEEAEREQMIGA